MSATRVHFGPANNDFLPLCGHRFDDSGLLICSIEPQGVTCLACLDTYEERVIVDEAELEEFLTKAADLAIRYVILDDLAHRTPWWNLHRKLRIEAIRRELEAERRALAES